MSIQITGRHIDISDAFRDSVESGLGDLSEKLNVTPVETNVILSKEGHQFLADIHAHISKGFNLRSRGEGGDAYSCFQNALDKMRTRVRKHKEFLDHHNKHRDIHFEEVSSYVMNRDFSTNGYNPEEDLSPAIIAEMKKEVPTLSVSDAVRRFDMSEDGAYIFRNAKNDALNVIYRRADGNIGWVDLTKECK